MTKKKQFAPHIYPEWGELFANLSDKQNAEILKAITQFPNYEPENNPIWNFIKSQIEKDYEIFIDKCNKNQNIIRNYWQKKKSNENECISDDNERIRTNTNEYECLPKRITNNVLRITNNEITETNNIIPTKKEIEDYCRQICRHINIDDFIAYYSVDGWQDDNGLPINWKRKVISWSMRQKEREEKPQKINDGLF